MSIAHGRVDLNAIGQNVKRVKKFAPHSKIMAVIKANAYGHGLLPVANALDSVDGFAVARTEEAVALRNAGIKKRISVLEGFLDEKEFNTFIEYTLDAVIHSSSQVDILKAFQGKQKITVWLKIDTGMNRLGFKKAQLVDEYKRLLDCTCVTQPLFLMTHLSSADDKKKPTTHQQVDCFNQLVNDLPGEIGEKSIANSAAIFAWPETITEWVRPGLMLYGVSPFPENTGQQLELKPAMSLYSKLIAIKNIDEGEAVGYSETWHSDKQTKLGVVAIGYGDGYPRYAKNGTPVLIHGQRVPLVGRVSMDMITVDLSLLANVKVGDLVTLWGDGLPIEEIAICADTIAYTLMCGVTQRVELSYVFND